MCEALGLNPSTTKEKKEVANVGVVNVLQVNGSQYSLSLNISFGSVELKHHSHTCPFVSKYDSDS